jgi:hypothetical protein
MLESVRLWCSRRKPVHTIDIEKKTVPTIEDIEEIVPDVKETSAFVKHYRLWCSRRKSVHIIDIEKKTVPTIEDIEETVPDVKEIIPSLEDIEETVPDVKEIDSISISKSDSKLLITKVYFSSADSNILISDITSAFVKHYMATESFLLRDILKDFDNGENTYIVILFKHENRNNTFGVSYLIQDVLDKDIEFPLYDPSIYENMEDNRPSSIEMVYKSKHEIVRLNVKKNAIPFSWDGFKTPFIHLGWLKRYAENSKLCVVYAKREGKFIPYTTYIHWNVSKYINSLEWMQLVPDVPVQD